MVRSTFLIRASYQHVWHLSPSQTHVSTMQKVMPKVQTKRLHVGHALGQIDVPNIVQVLAALHRQTNPFEALTTVTSNVRDDL